MIRTSHVGSFPLEYTSENVEKAVIDMYNIGVDVIPYPQLRNFIEIYLKPLEDQGYLYSRGSRFFIKRATESMNTAGMRINEAELAIDVVKRHKLTLKGLRAPVTGPFTLASKVFISETAEGLRATCLIVKDVVMGFFKEVVSSVVRYMEDLGYNFVFIDEPVFNYMIGKQKILFGYSEDEIIETLEYITNAGRNVEFGVHVCGTLNSRILDILTRVSRIKYISIELHDTPSNIDVISREVLDKNDKYLSPGVVSAQRTSIETVDEAYKILKASYEKTGGRIDLVSADCGFGGLRGTLRNREEEYNVALSKLRVVIEAAKRANKELGLNAL